MATTAGKLLIKPGTRVAVLPPSNGDAPPLGELPPDVEVTHDATSADVVLLFVASQGEQVRRQEVVNAVRQGAIVWFCFPKKTGSIASDLSRDIVWKTLEPAGWGPVTNVSIDDTWSALRMLPGRKVGA